MDWTEFEKSVTAIGCFNPSGDRLGHVPFSPEGLDAVANFVVSKLDRIPPTVLAPAHGSNGTADLARFLASLEVQMTVAPLTPEDEQEALNVVRHTTHFINLPGRKWEAGIVASAGSRQAGEAWTVRVRDRFGDYGVSGVVTFGVEDRIMRVGLLFLTCPVLGKQVEYALMSWIAELAEQRDAKSIEVPFVPGRDNHGLQTLLAGWSAPTSSSGSERCFSIPVPGLAERVTLEAPDPASAKAIFPRMRAVRFPISA